MKLNGFDFPLRKFFVDIFNDKIFIVGGTIRDFLLYNKIDLNRDIDLVVIDYTYDEIEKKLRTFGKTNTVGRSFAVVKFSIEGHTFDVSVPRKDAKKEKGSFSHKNFVVEHGPHITLEEDLKRRDFTCNSIAIRLIDNLVMDPFGGIKAIKEKKILMTGPENFFDDPLRILRGARFSSVHHFSIAEDIYLYSKAVRLDELSKERIQEELFRLLLESDIPSDGLNEYFKLSVLEKLFPQLYALTVTIQDSIFHPEKDEYNHHTVWIHTLITVNICRKLTLIFNLSEEETLALLLAALLHDVGKAETTKWEFKRGRMTITSLFHDAKGVKIARGFLQELKVETRKRFPLKKVILNIIKNHHRLYELYRNRKEIGFKAISRLVRDLDNNDFLLVLLDFADRQSRRSNPLAFTELDDISNWYLKMKSELNISKETIKPIITGKDLLALGFPPGREMGRILKILYESQLDGEFGSKKEGLKKARQMKKQQNG